MTRTRDAQTFGLPSDYYQRIREVEDEHWWHRGMRMISEALLGDRLTRAQRALDAGCGTGGFLQWMLGKSELERAAGIDVSAEAIELARTRVPTGDLHVAPLHRLPFEDSAFDLVVTNDVLQHVLEPNLDASLRELARVLEPSGTLLVRTNGARSERRERPDWRIYNRRSLVSALDATGFAVERATYVNVVGSLAALVRGRAPGAPTGAGHGIPSMGSRTSDRIGYNALRLEASYLRGPPRSLPYGHTLIAIASPRGET